MIALLWYNARAYVYLRCLRMRLMYSVTLKQGVQGDGVLLPGSGERCPGDSVKGPQLLSLLLAAAGGMHRTLKSYCILNLSYNIDKIRLTD